jgi:hypothetical protein
MVKVAMPPRWRLWVALVAFCPLGCSTCARGERAVPFKRGSSETASQTELARADAGAATEQPTPIEEGHSFGLGTTRVEVEGHPLETAGGVRAALAIHTSGDRAARGLLLVTEGPDKAPILARAALDGERWGTPEPVAPLADTAHLGCGLKLAGIQALGKSYALVSADFDCASTPQAADAPSVDRQAAAAVPAAAAAGNTKPAPVSTAAAPASNAAKAAPASAAAAPANNAAAPPAALPAPSAPPAPATAPMPRPEVLRVTARLEHHLWIATLEAAPRVVEHMATLEGGDSGTPRVVPVVRSRDLDGDGNPDLLLVLDVMVGDLEPSRVEIKLFNRVGGLARDTTEPEKTLLSLADQAKDERKRNPARALALAQRALGVHRALCQAGGVARLYLGGSRGLDCGASLGAGRAASVLTAVLASQGKLLEALERLQTLQQPTYRLTDNDWERARFALRSRVDEHGFAFRLGPALAPAASPLVRRGAIAFIDEGHLLLRGATPSSYDLASGATEATGIPADTTIMDPSGRFAIGAIVRGCDGYKLSIVQTAQLVAGVVTGPSASEPLFARADAPAGANCPELTREQRNDDGGYRVLEWTREGVLIAHGATMSLLPLDAAAAASTEARVLGPNDRLPALGSSGQVTSDGRFVALLTQLGIAIQERKSGASRVIAVPDEPGKISDIALSPSGRTLAFVRGDKVFIGSAQDPQPQIPSTAPAKQPLTPTSSPNSTAPRDPAAPAAIAPSPAPAQTR